MVRILAIDIGAGTQDILIWDSSRSEYYKLVAKAPTRILAEKILTSQGDLLITGDTMGGGPVVEAIKRAASERTVLMTARAAGTIHHDPERVRALGVQIIEEELAEAKKGDPSLTHITLGDVFPRQLEILLGYMGVEFSFDYLLIAVQDHGIPPVGVSAIDFRHQIFRQILERHPYPEAFLLKPSELPDYLARMKNTMERCREIPAAEYYIMDTGMAAILGASRDQAARRTKRILVLDIATSHTLGAVLSEQELMGFFEYHTQAIDPGRLERMMVELAEGRISHEKIRAEGGHGAYLRAKIGLSSLEAMIATGPRRDLVHSLPYPFIMGAPLGDNMMTGTAGLLEALNRREGLGLKLG